MSPILYSLDASSPCRAVLMTAKAIGLKIEEKTVNLLENEQLKTEFLKINPQHTIPTFVDDDGFILSDSHAIMAYIVSKYAKNDDLYTLKDLKRKAIIDQRLHFENGVLFARGLPVVQPIRYEETKEISEKAANKLLEAYDFLENVLEKSEYVAGNKLSIADFSIVTTITTWDVLVKIQDKHKNIKNWIKKIESLPYYEINRKGLNEFSNIIREKLQK